MRKFPRQMHNNKERMVLSINHLQSPLNQTQWHFYVTQTGNSLTRGNCFTQSKNWNTSDVSPTIEDGRVTLQTNLQEHPKLLVIHTRTNNLTPTSQIDEFVSEISAFVTEVSTKFPKSKIIYSTLLPRSNLPLNTITKINEQLINQLTNLHNVHVVSHDNVFYKGLDVLHDAKHLKKRHIGVRQG